MKKLLACCAVSAALSLTLHADLIWFDGSVDPSGKPPGKLLSGNEDYYGEVAHTGMTYSYREAPEAPADNRPNRRGKTGRVLVNGFRGKGVGMKKGRELSVTCDFKGKCVFSEFDIVSKSKKFEAKLELSSDGRSWTTLFEQSYEQSPEKLLHRIRLEKKPEGRYLRLTMRNPGKVTLLDEIIVWGDVREPSRTAAAIEAPAKGEYPTGVVYPTITGIGKSAVSDREAFYWTDSLSEEQKREKALWFQVSAWGPVSDCPLLPDAREIGRPIRIIMARNEVEHVAMALKNTLVEGKRDLRILQPAVRNAAGGRAEKISARLGIMGVIGDRGFGNNLGPIFHEGNLPGGELMEKFLLNGRNIRNYPEITLDPASAAVFWFTVDTDNASPGIYRTELCYEGGKALPIEIEVVDVVLPEVFSFVKTYSKPASTMFPFVYADRDRRDIEYMLDCGVSDFTTPTPAQETIIRELAGKQKKKVLFSAGFLIPPKYVHNIYCRIWRKADDFPPGAAEEIARHVKSVVEKMKARNLDYDDWYGTTGDEPGHHNMEAIAFVCRLIRKADPNVKIYLNPCYWTGFDRNAVTDDATVAKDLASWYSECVDLSIPMFLLLRKHPESFRYFSSPRFVNAYYLVSAHLDRSENAAEIQKYRKMAWESFLRNFNGWAFYSFYSPRGCAWDHFDRNPVGEGLQEPNDYSIVYPGPIGFVPTRQSEALRQGKEDFQLLHLLRQQGKTELLSQLMKRYRQGEAPERLRLEALSAAQSKQ